MTRKPLLTPGELVELDAVYRALYAEMLEVRAECPLASHVNLPKLPSELTEGLAALTAPAIFGDGATAAPGGKAADLIVDVPDGSQRLVEVKGTGVGGFSLLGPCDVGEVTLVWVDYARRLSTGCPDVPVWVFREPWQVGAGRVVLPAVLARTPASALTSLILRVVAGGIHVGPAMPCATTASRR